MGTITTSGVVIDNIVALPWEMLLTTLMFPALRFNFLR